MRTGLKILAAAAVLTTTGIAAAPAMAAGQYYDHGYQGDYHGRWDRDRHWDHHDRDWRRDERRRERERERWYRHHRDDRYGYGYGGYDGW